MSSSHPKNIHLSISGTHCAACEVMIERKFRKIPDVESVSADFTTGYVEVRASREPALAEFAEALRDQEEYRVSYRSGAVGRNETPDYAGIGGVALILASLFVVAKQFDLIPAGFGVTENMSYGFVFVLGLAAALSTCIAVTGGLIVAVASRYAERHPHETGWRRFAPHVSFNVGRVAGYTIFGAMVGGLGSFLALSPRVTGGLTLLVSLVMVMLGFQLLHLFPRLGRFAPRMPKFLAHRIAALEEQSGRGAAFVLGALTFFLPCGFTQALQLYVLSRGDAWTGALTMFVFSLGTLPALLSLGAISSFARGAFQRRFVQFAGVLVVVLGVLNIQSGLTLLGVSIDMRSAFVGSAGPSSVNLMPIVTPITDGQQVVSMRVRGYDYEPAQFTVQAGVPVEWRIDGTEAAGCAQVIMIPKLKLVQPLSRTGVTVIRFTPPTSGELPFSCTMGMTTPGAKFVVQPAAS